MGSTVKGGASSEFGPSVPARNTSTTFGLTLEGHVQVSALSLRDNLGEVINIATRSGIVSLYCEDNQLEQLVATLSVAVMDLRRQQAANGTKEDANGQAVSDTQSERAN